ncbi:PepSY domain-containing protein [Fictibacillus phosphorivorans]|uniref:PepSY domain-containing protein n=1 Tax=Fictibacillus phosphorivorans TaxID=1221500 RepID=UPI00203CEFDB|nr:PepSY domain-containing protein [Fictibacillus phosphorivorans]MCM3717558.1 PepSY domain-containing protein [Fictibacillus phosphorivorans]MCM3775253.1 PepSY domain-containing protein [Fictibacillus phosphorivorans]
MHENQYTPPEYRQRISVQQAQEIAIKRIPGQVIHVDMDLDHGVLVYEIYILTPQNRIFEVEIIARTGKILKIEEENDFD